MAARKPKTPAPAAPPPVAAPPAAGEDPVEALSAQWKDPATGELLTRQLAKAVLSHGAWATVMFLTQELDRQSHQYKAPRVSVRRYKKSGHTYRYQSSFNISSEKQARQLMDVLGEWFGKGGVGRRVLDEMGPDAAEEPDE